LRKRRKPQKMRILVKQKHIPEKIGVLLKELLVTEKSSFLLFNYTFLQFLEHPLKVILNFLSGYS
jgi:hypothetical protein